MQSALWTAMSKCKRTRRERQSPRNCGGYEWFQLCVRWTFTHTNKVKVDACAVICSCVRHTTQYTGVIGVAPTKFSVATTCVLWLWWCARIAHIRLCCLCILSVCFGGFSQVTASQLSGRFKPIPLFEHRSLTSFMDF